MQHDGEVTDPVGRVYDDFVELVRVVTAGDRVRGGGPTFVQHALLSYVARHDGCRATDVSDAFSVSRSTVSRQVRSCVDAGWIDDAVDGSTDGVGRGRPLRITALGRGLLDASSDRYLDDVRAGMSGWDDDEIARFGALLHRFRSGFTGRTTPDAPSCADRTSDEGETRA